MTIPTPEPGLVVNYAYLWHYEHRAGNEEGRKNRPSVIVLAVENRDDNKTTVTVLPITHARPDHPANAIEIPLLVKKHLGLDHERSWVVVDEGNEFVWPGYDLRRSSKTGDYHFGFLPPRLFTQIRDAFIACHQAGKTKLASRT